MPAEHALVSVVAPVYDEFETLPEFHRRVAAAMAGRSYELVLVDDGSTDGSAVLIEQLAAEDPAVRPVHLSRNFGHQAAVTAGLELARGAAAITIDADLQDPPEVIPRLLGAWEAGADVVHGVRSERRGESRRRLFVIRAFYKVFGRISGLSSFPGNSGDFRLISRRALDALNALPERNRFVRGLVSWVGFRQTSVVYERDARYAGSSKYPLRKLFAWPPTASCSSRPCRCGSRRGSASSCRSSRSPRSRSWWSCASPASTGCPGSRRWTSSSCSWAESSCCSSASSGSTSRATTTRPSAGRCTCWPIRRIGPMDEAFYATYFRIEGRHWWFVGRRRLFLRLIEDRFPQARRPIDVLDFGCGTGAFLEHLERFGGVSAVDADPHAVAFCHARGRTEVVLAPRAAALPFGDGSFDLVTTLDVIEHIDDDVAALAELRRVLRPGGLLLVAVPAYRFLWGKQDEVAQHMLYRQQHFFPMSEYLRLVFSLPAILCTILAIPGFLVLLILYRLLIWLFPALDVPPTLSKLSC